MCGIAGFIGKQSKDSSLVGGRFCDTLAHRGPDGNGDVTILIGDKSVTFAHRRLSIIDLTETGAQPMLDEESGNWVTFNGEIYNYKELQIDLESLGHVFKTKSDTEVILRSYSEWGDDCVNHFRGMFAFALWDKQNQKVFCAVDRFGIKPFYYTEQNKSFAFASEVRALIKSDVVERELDMDAIASFLSFGSVQAPRTILKNVSALLPAHTLTYDLANSVVETNRYWTPTIDDQKTKYQVKESLEASVRDHLVSDVPLGLFLSGGVDSSALAILAHRQGDVDLRAFNVSFGEEEYAEGKYARMIGEKFCSSYTEILVTEDDVRHQLPDVLDSMDQPSIDGVNAYTISKAVHDQGIKAVLSGQGGDEVFGGYPNFRRIPQWMAMASIHKHVPSRLRSFYAPFVSRIAPVGAARMKVQQLVSESHTLQSLYTLSRQLLPPDVVSNWLPSVKFDHKDSLKVFDPINLFNAISMMEMRGYMANTLLRDGDVMSMAHGLEVRVPYLDHRLVETVLALPENEKVHDSLPKPALLNAVRDDMPREIYDRKKMGFTFPWEKWLREGLRMELEEAFNDQESADRIGIDLSSVRSMWEAFQDRRDGISWSRVWAPFVLLRWVRINIISK
jgi:asparagine synthase (glutamine-hydrolysing)